MTLKTVKTANANQFVWFHVKTKDGKVRLVIFPLLILKS